MPERFVRAIALPLLAMVLLGACVAAPAAPDGTKPTLPMVGPLNPAVGPDADAAAELAKQILLTQLGVVALEVEVVSIEEVQWPSTALGCPAADQVYLQVIVPGYKVIVKVNGVPYAVHVGGEHAVVCSDEGTPMELKMVQPVHSADAVVAQVKADLAARLQVKVEEIEVVKAQSVQWRSSGLGCEQPGGRYLTVIVPGNLIVLKVGDALYEYHTGDGRIVLCSSSPATE